MPESFSNFAKTTLSAGISGSDLSIPLVLGDYFPASNFYIVLGSAAGSSEVVFVASRSANTLTVRSLSDRGLFGTSAMAHSTGTKVLHTVLAHHINASQSAAKLYMANNFI